MVNDHFNVILIAIDTLRADRVGCLGSGYPTMPNVDSLCRDSVAFTNHYAEAIPTHPSFTTIFTGTTPLIHSIVSHGGKVQLSGSILTLPQILNEAGYLTIAVDNLATHMYAGWFARGYRYYIDIGGLVVISNGIKVNGEYVNAKVKDAFELINRYKNEPFLLFIHYWDPHAPYIPPKPYAEKFYHGDYSKGDLVSRLNSTAWGRLLLKDSWIRDLINSGVNDPDYIRALYDSEAAYVDERIGELMSIINNTGLLEDTLIVLTSDHGEGLGEHNVYYEHHGLYEWDVKTPLIIRLPDKLIDEVGRGKAKGVKYDAFVQNTDITPTILDSLGLKIPEYMTGLSLLKVIRGESKGHDAVFSLENTRQTARMIRVGEWKLIQWIRNDTYGRRSGHVELYNLAKDPTESRNMATEEGEITLRLLGLIERRYREVAGANDPLILQEISVPIKP
ncbi:sulfatase [Caldivirga maquilingensis]|uniref:Sulfatase n=1 Tax=Caldivirga maquilingensis (strain ATCC 700844 / DSM 13496 / JCM 10307 / IC-167) TaxID=397948 RepID=A8MAP9_CALMQ|nr:sulfatase [Caldivirga maquilingensis]ABW01085.1 sulfatase [Caldivirga maquilingensis IC-167]